MKSDLFFPITNAQASPVKNLELWGSWNLSAHPHISSHPVQDCSNRTMFSAFCSALWMGLPCLWATGAGLHLLDRMSQIQSLFPVCVKCLANVCPVNGWRRLPHLSHSNLRPHICLCLASCGGLVICLSYTILFHCHSFNSGLLIHTWNIAPSPATPPLFLSSLSLPPFISLLSSPLSLLSVGMKLNPYYDISANDNSLHLIPIF